MERSYTNKYWQRKEGQQKIKSKIGISSSNIINKVSEKIIVKIFHNEICLKRLRQKKEKRSTTDHIFTLKSVIRQRFYEKKTTCASFIDLEKNMTRLGKMQYFIQCGIEE